MGQTTDGVGDLYHRETKYRRDAVPGGGLHRTDRPPLYKESYPAKQLPVHPPDLRDGKSLWETISQRRSVRDFSDRSITFHELSQLLWATQGITLKAWGFDFRASPSAGGLYPIETYLGVNRVEEVSPGIYHYDVKRAQLSLLKEGNFGSDLREAGLSQEMLEDAACVFIWAAIVKRSKWKYRERAYRYIYMDAGHIAQNLYLAATALNLGCCTVGAFYDEEVDRIIGVDGTEEVSVYLGAIGRIRR